MIERLFPKQFDNRFEGHRAALWLLGLFVALRSIMGINSIFNTESVARGADGFPLDSYGADAARLVLMLFAMSALGQLTVAVIGLVALVRYRAMVPFIYLVLVCDQLARRSLVLSWEVARSESSPVGWYIGVGLLVLTILGLVLSLWPRARRSAALQQPSS